LNVNLPYGKNFQELEIPENYNVDIIAPSDVLTAPDPLEIVRQAILSPMGSSLPDYAKARSVAIAVNDKTRPVPHQLLLPPLLQELERIGISSKAIHLFIATGTHQPMPSNEFPSILPPGIIEKYAVVSHNCDDMNNLVELGATQYGTIVLANKLFYESDLLLAFHCQLTAPTHGFVGSEAGH